MNDRTTVLVVDDEPEIVVLMSDFLRAEGYQVLTASDGNEALAVLHIVPGLEGEFVNLRESTAAMSKSRGSSLIEYTMAFMANHELERATA